MLTILIRDNKVVYILTERKRFDQYLRKSEQAKKWVLLPDGAKLS